VLGIAYAFRTSNWLVGYPHSSTNEILKVDILNCMGAAMLAVSLLATTAPKLRARSAIALGLVVAGAAPIVDGLAWTSAPAVLRNYIVPSSGRFPLFPWAAYLAFGVAAGAVLKRTPPERLERAMQWSVLAGFGLIFSAQYFSNIPFSVYPSSSFWINSPALVFIRTGISLVLLAAAYVWTEFGAGSGWSWVQALGKTSLLVYWLHILIVYGDIAKPLKKSFTIPQAALAALVVTGLMVAVAAARLWWKGRRAARLQLAAAA
jgi:uncharacterized membrane protein